MTPDLDEIYRRASARDTSRPSEAVRRRVLEHAAAVAAGPQRPTANRARWRPAIFGTLAAAALAGLLIVPRVFNPQPSAESADTAAPAQVPPLAAPPLAGAPPGAGPGAGAPPLADSAPMNSAPAPAPFPPPQAAARSRAIAPVQGQTSASRDDVQATQRTAEASRSSASRL